MARPQFRDTGSIDVEPDYAPAFAEFDRKRQANITQADDGDPHFFERGQFCEFRAHFW